MGRDYKGLQITHAPQINVQVEQGELQHHSSMNFHVWGRVRSGAGQGWVLMIFQHLPGFLFRLGSLTYGFLG